MFLIIGMRSECDEYEMSDNIFFLQIIHRFDHDYHNITASHLKMKLKNPPQYHDIMVQSSKIPFKVCKDVGSIILLDIFWEQKCYR